MSQAATDHWSSRWVFLLATIGFAVGLGNVWKFPYVTGENGGGAFILVYLGCAFLIGMPIVIAEMMLGRRGGGSPVTVMQRLATGARGWRLLGWLVMATAFAILSFYAVIGGWTLDYVLMSALGRFSAVTPDESAAIFDGVLASPGRLILSQSLFLALTLGIAAFGLHRGIERAVTLMMPLLFVLLLALVAYALVVGDAAAGLRFLFAPDFSKLDGGAVLAAVGQAFFSIGVGMAAMMMYGAYLLPGERLFPAAGIVVAADTAVAILAGVAIFPLVFGFGMAADQGPGLVFVTLPVAFGQMPYGLIFGTLFFVLLAVAALTSAIALCEPVMAFAGERGVRRRTAAAVYGAVLWLTGLLSVFSFNLWSDWQPLGFLARFAGMTIFDVLDFFTANLMLPLGGLLVALFVGWGLPATDAAAELGLSADRGLLRLWRGLLRWLVPPALLAMIGFGVWA